MSINNSQLIADIQALSQRVRGDSQELTSLAQAVQHEADRFQEMANICTELRDKQDDASRRLGELANGAEPFRLPSVYTRDPREPNYPPYQQ